jgi:hypothetical protein
MDDKGKSATEDDVSTVLGTVTHAVVPSISSDYQSWRNCFRLFQYLFLVIFPMHENRGEENVLYMNFFFLSFKISYDWMFWVVYIQLYRILHGGAKICTAIVKRYIVITNTVLPVDNYIEKGIERRQRDIYIFTSDDVENMLLKTCLLAIYHSWQVYIQKKFTMSFSITSNRNQHWIKRITYALVLKEGVEWDAG